MIEKLPAPFWAVLLAAQGTIIALCVLFVHRDAGTSSGVLGIGSSLVTGALGAFAGHAYATSKLGVTTNDAPVTINQSK
jgi:hypothetical protein